MNPKDFINFDLAVSRIEMALTKKSPVNWIFKMDSRPFHGFVYIQTGCAEFIFKDKTAFAHADDIVYLRKGDSYTIKSLSDVSLEFTVVSFEIEGAADLPFGTVIKAGHTHRILEMFIFLEEMLISRGIAHLLCCRSTLEQIIFHLISEGFNSAELFGRLQASINYIENFYNSKIEIGTLADIAGLSLSHYRRVFKEIYGVPPIQYINKIRVEKAKNMLKSGLYSQGEIALQCGFENPQYFSRVFKKFTDIPPGAY